MKAITIWQPWASLIALGYKTIETRTHSRLGCLHDPRERFAIHAACRFDEWAAGVIAGVLERWRAHYPRLPVTSEQLADPNAWPRGAVVGTARGVGFGVLNERYELSALCPCDGLWGLFVADARALPEPVPARGFQGVWSWTPPPDLNLGD